MHQTIEVYPRSIITFLHLALLTMP